MVMWKEKKYFCGKKKKCTLIIHTIVDFLSFHTCSLLDKLMEMSFLHPGVTLYSNVAYYVNISFKTVLFQAIFGGMLEDAKV